MAARVGRDGKRAFLLPDAAGSPGNLGSATDAKPPSAGLTPWPALSNQRASVFPKLEPGREAREGHAMKIRNSLKSAKTRDKNCRVVRRHGRVYVINKKNPRMKARQG